MPTYRPLTDDEEGLYRSYTRYAFSPQRSADDPVPDGPRSIGDRRGLFPDDGSRPYAVCAHHWFESTVRGCRLSTPGIAAVATPPEHRRQGHARTLLRRALEEYRDRDAHVSVLWPFAYGFYRSLGWETAYRMVLHEVEPATLRSAADAPSGTFEPVEPDDVEVLDEIYRADSADDDLAVGRDEAWWRHRILEGWRGERYAYCWRDEAGEARAYVVFELDGEDRSRELTVADHGATDAAAYRQLLRFLADHDSQAGTVRLGEPADAPLLDRLTRHAGLSTTLYGGAMVRLVEADRVLEAVDYPPSVSADVVLSVDDGLVGWHDDPIRLTIDGGGATAEPVEADPDVELDIATLSAVVVGARPVAAFGAAGRITGEDAAIEALDAAFRPRRVYCHDQF